jgi:predicted nucleic acid-binding protein
VPTCWEIQAWVCRCGCQRQAFLLAGGGCRQALRNSALHGPDPKPFRDGLIAATALGPSLVVVTRNPADFEATGVPLLNPWQQG